MGGIESAHTNLYPCSRLRPMHESCCSRLGRQSRLNKNRQVERSQGCAAGLEQEGLIDLRLLKAHGVVLHGQTKACQAISYLAPSALTPAPLEASHWHHCQQDSLGLSFLDMGLRAITEPLTEHMHMGPVTAKGHGRRWQVCQRNAKGTTWLFAHNLRTLPKAACWRPLQWHASR